VSEVDGWITIGTKLTTKDLEKQYNQLTRELEKKQQEAEKYTQIKSKLDVDIQEYEKQKQLIEESTNKTLEQAQTQEQVNWVLENEKMSLEDLNTKYSSQIEKNSEINQKINENAKSQENLRKKISDTNNELNKSRSFSGIKGAIDNIGKSVEGVTNKVIRWGLAIFGIRSAYMFVRQAMSTLSQYNEQLASNLQYIRFALATALEPIIIRIVEWVYKLLSLVGTIIKLLTGYDIFKNSGVDKYQKATAGASKNLASGAKSAKEINKQLAGFDEMNILSDNSSAGTGGAGGAGGGASGTLPNLKLDSNMKLPKWMKELLGYGDKLIAIILGIAGALKLLQLGFIKPDQFFGFALGIGGIVYAIEGLIKYLKDPSWKNFGQIIQGIGIAIIGIGGTLFGLPAIVAGVAVLIVGIVIANWKKIKDVLDTAINWLTTQMNNVKDKYGYFAGLIVQGVRDQVKNIKTSLDTIFKSARNILDNIISFFRNVFTGNWKGAWQNIVNIAKSVFEILITSITFKLKTIKNVLTSTFGVIGDVISGIIKGAINLVFRYIENKINTAIGLFNGVLSAVNKLPGVSISKIGKVSLPRLAQGGIVNNPGPGVMMGSYVAGERGPEAVLPLTDDTLQRLANMMPITVHVTNSMNGRVISREIQKVQNQSNFAMNR